MPSSAYGREMQRRLSWAREDQTRGKIRWLMRPTQERGLSRASPMSASEMAV